MTKSLRRMGRVVSGRAVVRSPSLPAKKASSVRMERAAAPAASYWGVTSSGRASRLIQPFDGERRLNSAMMPVGEAARACFRLWVVRCSFLSAAVASWSAVRWRFCVSTSSRLCAMISFRMSLSIVMSSWVKSFVPVRWRGAGPPACCSLPAIRSPHCSWLRCHRLPETTTRCCGSRRCGW